MARLRDGFSKAVADALAKRAAYICSNPDCRTLTVAPSEHNDEKFLYIGKAAHIYAAAEGGPRYSASMSSEERKAASNGIFLCSNCADMIDKNGGADFRVERLVKWKRDHETWVGKNLNKRRSDSGAEPFTFQVQSVGQLGGITAGIVNVAPPRRQVDASLRQQLAKLLPDKSKTVTVVSLMGDNEAHEFATQIKDHLVAQGYSVNGVNQAVFGDPVAPQAFDPSTLSIIVGSRM